MYKYNGLYKTEELMLVGLSTELGTNQKLNYKKVTELWKNFNPNVKNIKERKNGKDWIKYGVSYDRNVNKTYKYMASIEVSQFQNLPDDLITKIVPSQEYYHFTHSGSMEYLIHSIYSIYKVWLPEKKLKVKPNTFSQVNHVERYDKRFYWTRADSEIDILIPMAEL